MSSWVNVDVMDIPGTLSRDSKLLSWSHTFFFLCLLHYRVSHSFTLAVRVSKNVSCVAFCPHVLDNRGGAHFISTWEIDTLRPVLPRLIPLGFPALLCRAADLAGCFLAAEDEADIKSTLHLGAAEADSSALSLESCGQL